MIERRTGQKGVAPILIKRTDELNYRRIHAMYAYYWVSWHREDNKMNKTHILVDARKQF